MSKDNFTFIRVTKKTVERLKNAGKKGDTYEDIIIKLLDLYEKQKNNQRV